MTMAIRLYNTLTRHKEEFVPREPGVVSMYVCGPTVYNHIHIGNARTFLTFDVIRRYLAFRGFDVRFVQNITDVDDKIIARANEEGREPAEVAAEYTRAFQAAMDALGVQPPTVQPKATDTIDAMIEMTLRLIERGHAYVIDGDVYFAVRSFAGYGKLSGRNIDELESGSRVGVDERKNDPLDFALWKSAKPGEPHWSSPWGEGRPGWHLECSVMSERELGLTFDIHGGASDLIFPHHENEIAQSEAATGQPFVRYWMHAGLLQVDQEKMSKSLGNFLLLKDVLQRYPAPVVRLLMLQTHYRSPLDFSTDRLDEAARAYDRLITPVRNFNWAKRNRAAGELPEATPSVLEALTAAPETARAAFSEAMDDDFNTAGALAAIFDLVRVLNSFLEGHGIGASARYAARVEAAAGTIVDLLGVLGVEMADEEGASQYPPAVLDLARDYAGYDGTDARAAVEALLAARAAARSERNWAAADGVRDGLAALGFIIEDTPSGARVSYRDRG
ncbi:MAG: cysteine--tRNA ligase [Coriobacteriia bacterium]|nr:cysteine--tRNA ligase [Coriobacteriia bacterium]MBN2839936.1 cysteine--tRNA ligase [Coriobacteriia bacterium]